MKMMHRMNGSVVAWCHSGGSHCISQLCTRLHLASSGGVVSTCFYSEGVVRGGDLSYPGCLSTSRPDARLPSAGPTLICRSGDLGYAPAIEVASCHLSIWRRCIGRGDQQAHRFTRHQSVLDGRRTLARLTRASSLAYQSLRAAGQRRRRLSIPSLRTR
jgi:hypothetical protein